MSSLFPLLIIFLIAWLAIPALRYLVYTYIAAAAREYREAKKRMREAKRIEDLIKKTD